MVKHSYFPNLCLTAEAEQMRRAFNAMAATAPMCTCDDTPGGTCLRCDHLGSPRSQERNPDIWQLAPVTAQGRYIGGFIDREHSSTVISTLQAFAAQQLIRHPRIVTEPGIIGARASGLRVSYARFTWSSIPNNAVNNVLRAMEVARSIKMDLHREVRRAARAQISWCLHGFAYYVPLNGNANPAPSMCFVVTAYSHDEYNPMPDVLGSVGENAIGFVSVESKTDAEQNEILRCPDYFFSRSNRIKVDGTPIRYERIQGRSGRVYVPPEEINSYSLVPTPTGNFVPIPTGTCFWDSLA